MLFLIRKRHIKGGEHIAPMDFAEYLRKSEVSENSKVYYCQFLRNGFHERHLKSASHCLLVERWKWMIKVVLLEIYPYVFYIPPLTRGRHSLVRNIAAEKKVDIAI